MAVAGCGIAGSFAAIAAARAGATVAVIDRFGMPGGNMGPGYMQGGSLVYFDSIIHGRTELVREFHQRLSELRVADGAGVDWSKQSAISARAARKMRQQAVTAWDQESGVASYVVSKMMQEAGVIPMLAAYAADPILEGDRVKGLYVETVSGRKAVRAQVTIDATGEAAVAARAGCPMLRPSDERPRKILDAVERMKPTYPTFGGAEMAKVMGIPSMGGYVLIGGVDTKAYTTHEEKSGAPCVVGEIDFSRRTEDIEGVGQIEFQLNRGCVSAEGLAGLRLEIKNVPDAGDADVLSRLEFHARIFCFETVQLMRQHTPGCARSCLLFVSPFIGCRGGTCIDGEYSLTADDMAEQRRFDDIIYIPQLVTDDGTPVGFNCDVPYRVLLPKGVDGLLCVGRSASHRRMLRTRPNCMLQGDAAGVAAALAVETGKTPKTIGVRDLQRLLLKAGFYLGDEARLGELGLAQ